jgi:hypothetical protein
MTKDKKLDPHIERMRAAREKVQERIEDRRRQHQTPKVHGAHGGAHGAHGANGANGGADGAQESWCYETMDGRAEDEHS